MKNKNCGGKKDMCHNLNLNEMINVKSTHHEKAP